MRQITNTLWDNSLINSESTHRHLIIFMRQFNSQTLWWSLILNLKQYCWGIVSENVVELFRNLCFWFVISINSLDFPESQCNVNRSFWPRLGHFEKCCFSLSRERALFSFQPDFFTKLNTCPSVHSYTYNNAYIITFSLWPKQPKTEMTHSENWPKWPTYQVRNNPPPKFGWNNPRQINPGPKWPTFRSISQFNSQ